MTDDERKTEDLVAGARRALAPRPGDAQQVRRAIGIAVANGTSVATMAARLGPHAWRSRLLVVGAIAAASGGGYWAGFRAGRLAERPPAPAVVEGSSPQSATPATPERPGSLAAAQPPPAPAAPLARHRGGPVGDIETPATPRPSSLAIELRTLRNTERALRDGNAGLALTFLDELDREVPHGQLTEEREAASVLARCARGDRPFGVDLAAEFAEHYPASVYRTRIERTCAGTDSSPSGDSLSRRKSE
jgi:hypothetical protein